MMTVTVGRLSFTVQEAKVLRTKRNATFFCFFLRFLHYNKKARLMSAITITTYADDLHRDQVADLWKTVFGYETAHNNPYLSIERKLAVDDQLLFVAVDDKAVVGTVMAGYDGHRGWIYSLAVAPTHRRRGVGSRLVLHAERALAARGCMKINLQILEGNEAVTTFYETLGYVVEKRISMGKRIPENVPKA
jgi:ribosomal protein S18 acetylase RimI-like enzyme